MKHHIYTHDKQLWNSQTVIVKVILLTFSDVVSLICFACFFFNLEITNIYNHSLLPLPLTLFIGETTFFFFMSLKGYHYHHICFLGNGLFPNQLCLLGSHLKSPSKVNIFSEVSVITKDGNDELKVTKKNHKMLIKKLTC